MFKDYKLHQSVITCHFLDDELDNNQIYIYLHIILFI